MLKHERLKTLLNQGGVYYNISGNSVSEVLKDAVEQIKVPPSIQKQNLLNSLIEREQLLTTALGNGIAIPHPRAPIVADEEDQAIYVCYLDNEVDFNSMDSSLVFALFILITSNASTHLETLSELSWLLQQNAFISKLKEKPNTSELLETIQTLKGESK